MKQVGVIGLAAAVLAMAAIGCGKQPLGPDGVKLLQEGMLAYQRGEDLAAIQKLDTFLVRYPRTHRTDEAYYYRGLAHYRRGNADQATSDFRAALQITDREDLEARARLAMADAAYGQGKMPEAEELYRRALDELSTDEPPTDHVLYQLGACLQRQRKWHEADLYFDCLIGDFWKSEYADRARRRIRGEGWTVQAGAFADRARAKSQAAAFQEQGLDAFIVPENLDGKLHYLVRVGKHTTYEQAAETLPAVEKLASGAYVTVFQ